MSQQPNASIEANEAIKTISEIKSFLKSTTDVPVEPYQFIVLGMFFYIYPVFDAVIHVLRSTYDSYLVMNDYATYKVVKLLTGVTGFSDAEFYFSAYARELLYAVSLFYLINWVARKKFASNAALNPVAVRIRRAINGIVFFGFLAGYAIAYNGKLDHFLPMLVTVSGICFFIIGNFTRALVRYLGIALGILGIITLLTMFGKPNPYLYNIIFFFSSGAILATGLLMLIENRFSGRSVQ